MRFFSSLILSIACVGLLFARLPSRAAESSFADLDLPAPESIFAPPPVVSDSDVPVDDDATNTADADDALAKELADLKKRQDQLEKDLKKNAKQLVHPGHSKATMKVTGRVHLDYWAFPGSSPGVNAFETGNPLQSPQDRFGFRRIRFGVRGGLPENMEYRIEMEFADSNDSEFRDVWIGWNELPLLQTLLIGNQKRPYGLDYVNSSRLNVFIERPLVVEALVQDTRRLGIATYGVSADERYNWRLGIYNQRPVSDEGTYVSDHYQPELAGRFANTLWYDECCGGENYIHWGVSGTIANTDGRAGIGPIVPGLAPAQNEARFRSQPEARSTSRWINTQIIDGADTFGILGAEAVVNLGPLQLVGETMNLWLGRMAGFGEDLHFHGGYMYLSYFLTGEHIPWNRKSGTIGRVEPFENFYLVANGCNGVESGIGAWQIAARWSFADFTDEDVAGGIGESLTLGLNWWWTPYARMQFNYIYGNIDDHAPIAGQTFGHYHIFGTRLAVDF